MTSALVLDGVLTNLLTGQNGAPFLAVDTFGDTRRAVGCDAVGYEMWDQQGRLASVYVDPPNFLTLSDTRSVTAPLGRSTRHSKPGFCDCLVHR